MNIDSADPAPAPSVDRDAHAGADEADATSRGSANDAGHATSSGGDADGRPGFATVLASASAPAQNKPQDGSVHSAINATKAPSAEGKKALGTKSAATSQKKKSTDDDAESNDVPVLPLLQQQPKSATPLTLPSFQGEPRLTETSGAPLENALASPFAAADGPHPGANPNAAAPHLGEFAGLDRAALSLEASAAIDARNGLAATSGVHRTAKAIADDQIRIGVTPSESARTYAAIAKSTASPTTPVIHSVMPQAAETHAHKTESAATPIDTDTKTQTPVHAPGSAQNGRSGEHASSNDDTRGREQPDERTPAKAATATSDDAKPADVTAPTTTTAHASFTLPLPTHVSNPTETTQVAKPTEVRAAELAEDLMSGVEKAAASGRTNFEVQAFDGTRVAINVRVSDDKVHVGFAFDAKHTAAEATVRATLGTLENRLSERGLSPVVSFGSLQKSPHEVGITATNSAGAGSNATANGNGQNGKNNGDPRGEPQLADVTELTPRTRQNDARTGNKTPAPPTTGGRGGWVA